MDEELIHLQAGLLQRIASVLRERNGNGCGQNENASSARSPRASSRMDGNASTDSPLGRRREHQPLPFASDGCTDNPESTGQRQLLIERKGSSEHPSRSPDPAAIRIESPLQYHNGQQLAYVYFDVDGPSTLAAIPAIRSIAETLTKMYHPYWLMLRILGAAAIPAAPAIRHADDRNRFLRNGLIVSFNTTSFLLRS